MREKGTRKLLATAVVAVVLLCSTLLMGDDVGAAQSSTAFECQKAVALRKEGKFTVSREGITLKEDDKANGIMISGDASAFSKASFQYGGVFDFQEQKPDYLVVDALAERKKKIQLAFYFDDEKEPFAIVNPARQKKAEIWSTVKNRCVNLADVSVTGSHKLRFRVITEEKGNVSLAFRSLTFIKSDIPTMDFSIDESQGTIAEMNGDSKHNTECYGNVTLSIPEGYQSEYTSSKCKTQTYELDYIRGRGNSTWMADKKPYKLKLDKKQDLLGMGKNKHWVLLANYYDVSMLRNKITYWLGERLGMEFTPQCEFVNVVMNGEYLGSYYLCEQVRVGESRVDIDDLEEDEQSKNAVDEKTISGGYLLSMCPYGDEDGQVITTDKENRFLIESPSFEDYLNQAQLTYISNYMQKTENAIYGKDFKDAAGVSYQEYMDVDSAIDYYWIQEVSMNADAFASTSTYLYKKRNGKLYWGPLWDFDYVAWGAVEYSANQCTGYSCNSSAWFGRLFQDPVFYRKAVERWPEIKKQLLEACRDGGQIDKYSQKQYESQKHNYEIWEKYSDRIGTEWIDAQLASKDSEITYDSEVERLKKWIRARVEWIDNNLAGLKKEFYTVRFEVDGTELTSVQVEKNDVILDLPAAPEKKGYLFQGWYVPANANGTKEYQLKENSTVSGDITAVAKWVKIQASSEIEKIGFARKDYYIFCDDKMELGYCFLPFTAYSDSLTWKSSNTEIAEVEDGVVLTGTKTGDAVITATAENGVKASCTVHVIDYSEYADLESISIESERLTIKKGEYTQIQTSVYPVKAMMFQNIRYASSDESVVKVNDCGYVYGVSEGTAVVAVYYDGSAIKFCTVTVKGKQEAKPAVQVKKGTAFMIDGLKYKVTKTGNDAEVCCTGAKSDKLKKLVVPDTVTYQKKSYKVTSVGGFEGYKKLTQVTIGKNVQKINSKAFYNCSELKKMIILSKKLSKVGKDAVKGTSEKLTFAMPKGKELTYQQLFS